MDYFLGSVKIMLIVYILAAVISLAVASIIKGIFFAIRMQKAKVRPVQTGPAPSERRA